MIGLELSETALNRYKSVGDEINWVTSPVWTAVKAENRSDARVATDGDKSMNVTGIWFAK